MIITVLILWFMASVATAQQKYLIEFGWDEPTTSFMKSHIAEMEKTPFDGMVYHVQYTKKDGSEGSFMNECWGTRAFTDAELKKAQDDLTSTRFSKLTQNFLRFNVCPGDVDWFSDFSAVAINARQSARLATLGKSAGILFDIEQYNFPLFQYSKQKLAGTKSWDDYAKQTYQRGVEIMSAFQRGWKSSGNDKPLIIFLTYGYSLPNQETNGDRSKLATASYGLLAPFLDGMYEAASELTTIVDGYEFAYPFKTDTQFKKARQLVFEKLPQFVTDPAKYKTHTSLGFGLWMDYDWRKRGWDVADPMKNFFTPQQFGASVKLALEHADRYVWIYTETPRWWSATGKSEKLPDAYVNEIRDAKGH